MNADPVLVNRVAESDLQTIALDQFVHEEIVSLDLKGYLFRELILREKDFRDALKQVDWAQYHGKVLAVYCSTDAIIPMWAYMLIASYATPYAIQVIFGSPAQAFEQLLLNKINEQDWSTYQDKRVVIKGCSDQELPASAYLAISNKLQPFVQSLMYGEPCSTVPIFKRPRVIK